MFTKLRTALSARSEPYQRRELSIFSPGLLAAVANDPSAAAASYDLADKELRAVLPPAWRDLTAAQRVYLFASTLAHNLKPYGPGTTADLPSMLAAKTLDCSNYGLLTHYLAKACDPAGASCNVAFVGWDGGAIGNHQILFAADPSQPGSPDLLLDPTVGLAALASFDTVASGRPISTGHILALNPCPSLEASRTQVASALARGAFRPSDLLYYFESIEQLLAKFGHPSSWPTPGAVAWRTRERLKDSP